MFYPMHTANMQAIKALGHSGTFLKLEFLKKSLELIGLLLVMNISVTAIAINMAVKLRHTLIGMSHGKQN